MGCSQFTKSPVSSSIKPRSQNPPVIRAGTNTTLNITNILSSISTIKNKDSPEKNCVRVKFRKQFNQFILEDFECSTSLNRKLYTIRKYWLIVEACQSQFELLTHGMCINNYTIESGILVMMISATASQGFSCIKLSEELPFIELFGVFNSETSVIIRAWKEIVNALAVMKNVEVVRKVEGYAEFFEEYIVDCNANDRWLVKKGIKLAKELLARISQISLGIVRFVKDVDVNRTLIEMYASEAKLIGKFTGSAIVHLVLSEKQNN